MFAEDVALMRDTEAEKRWPWAILDGDKEMLTRPMPSLFTVYKVQHVSSEEFNFALHVARSAIMFGKLYP